jgi:predicted nucleotidyltransferase
MTDPMLNDDPYLAEIVRRLVAALRPERIYLFGSKARREDGRDSGYDLMVLVSGEDSTSLRKLTKQAYEALRGTGVAADVLVWSIQAFENRRHIVASLPATIVREGRLLYAD